MKGGWKGGRGSWIAVPWLKVPARPRRSERYALCAVRCLRAWRACDAGAAGAAGAAAVTAVTAAVTRVAAPRGLGSRARHRHGRRVASIVRAPISVQRTYLRAACTYASPTPTSGVRRPLQSPARPEPEPEHICDATDRRAGVTARADEVKNPFSPLGP